MIPLTTEGWTEEEHNGFLHGLEVYGYGNWDAIAVFVPSRSPPQIEAYAQQYVAQGEVVQHPQAATAAQHGSVQDMSSVSQSGGGHGGIYGFHEGSGDGEASFAHVGRHLDPAPQSSGLSRDSAFVDNGSVSGSAFLSHGASGELPVLNSGASWEDRTIRGGNSSSSSSSSSNNSSSNICTVIVVFGAGPEDRPRLSPPENDEAARLRFTDDAYFGLLRRCATRRGGGGNYTAGARRCGNRV